MLSTSNVTLPEIPSLGDWDDLIKTETEPEKEPQTEPKTEPAKQLTRAHSLQRNLSQPTEEGDIRKEVINIATTDPSHLFWVPASQHPEIAPTEFERYVDAHDFMVRKKSVKRRQSVLSVYFTADQPKEETKRLNDVKRKSVLRRSVSMQLPNDTHQVPDFLIFDRNSSPLDQSQAIVPKADRRALHRRGARTNFKKNASAPQRPPLTSRKSESDSHSLSPERVTLVDECVTDEQNPIETKEQVQDLEIGEIQYTEATVQRSISTASSRKSTWSWSFWSDEKSSRKNKVDPIESEMKQTSKSADIPSRRFTLSSLFSRRHKNNNQPIQIDGKDGLTPPKDFQLNRMYMTRLPLHVERAIYKLSHVKLANPRRPLKEQVLISNLMFWYLSVISTAEQKQIQPRKLMGKKKRPTKKAKSKANTSLMSNNSLRHQSTGFVVPENYLNPKQPLKKKSPVKQLDSSSDDDDDDDDDDSISSGSSDDEDDIMSLGRRKQKEDDLPLAVYKIKK